MHGDVNKSGKTDGVSCSTCRECSIRIAEESTPLIASPRSNANCFVIMLLFFALCFGTSIGTYLLIEEIEWESDQPFPLPEDFILSQASKSSEFWQVMDKVKLIEVPDPPCDNDSRCLERIDRFTREHFNQTGTNAPEFFVDANATIYRHLGLNNSYSNCDNSTIVIAISRADTEVFFPSYSQMYKVEEILDYGVKYNRLNPCCLISATKDVNWLQSLGGNIQNDINQRYNCTSGD